jgi:putative acetyltransferase
MATPHPVFCRAAAADAAAVRDVHIASIRAVCSDDYDAEQIDAWAQPSALSQYRAAILDNPFFVAKVAGKVVAFAEVDPERAEIKAVYVHPTHLRQGLGTALLLTLEGEARAHGVKRLALDASIMAEPFYGAAGYESVKRCQHTLPGGVTLACVRMRKDL